MNVKNRVRNYPPAIWWIVLLFVVLVTTGCGSAAPTVVPTATPVPSDSELWNEWALENRPVAPSVLEVSEIPEVVDGYLELDLLLVSEAQKTWYEVYVDGEVYIPQTEGTSLSHSLTLSEGTHFIEVSLTAANFPPQESTFVHLGAAESFGSWTREVSVDVSPVSLVSEPTVISEGDMVYISGVVEESNGSVTTIGIIEVPTLVTQPKSDGFFEFFISRSDIGVATNLTLQLQDRAGNNTLLSVYVPFPSQGWVGRLNGETIVSLRYDPTWHPFSISSNFRQFLFGWGGVEWYRITNGVTSPVAEVEPWWWLGIRFGVPGILILALMVAPSVGVFLMVRKYALPQVRRLAEIFKRMGDVAEKRVQMAERGVLDAQEERAKRLQLQQDLLALQSGQEELTAALELFAQGDPIGGRRIQLLLTHPKGRELVEAKLEERRGNSVVLHRHSPNQRLGETREQRHARLRAQAMKRKE